MGVLTAWLKPCPFKAVRKQVARVFLGAQR
jgi:hypothetical protein